MLDGSSSDVALLNNDQPLASRGIDIWLSNNLVPQESLISHDSLLAASLLYPVGVGGWGRQVDRRFIMIRNQGQADLISQQCPDVALKIQARVTLCLIICNRPRFISDR